VEKLRSKLLQFFAMQTKVASQNFQFKIPHAIEKLRPVILAPYSYTDATHPSFSGTNLEPGSASGSHAAEVIQLLKKEAERLLPLAISQFDQLMEKQQFCSASLKSICAQLVSEQRRLNLACLSFELDQICRHYFHDAIRLRQYRYKVGILKPYRKDPEAAMEEISTQLRSVLQTFSQLQPICVQELREKSRVEEYWEPEALKLRGKLYKDLDDAIRLIFHKLFVSIQFLAKSKYYQRADVMASQLCDSVIAIINLPSLEFYDVIAHKLEEYQKVLSLPDQYTSFSVLVSRIDQLENWCSSSLSFVAEIAISLLQSGKWYQAKLLEDI